MTRSRIFGRIQNIPKWQKLVAAIVLIVVTFSVAWFIWPRADNARTRFIANISTPHATQFTDNASSAFLSSDNVPDINNNRRISDITPLTIYYQWQSGPYGDAFRPNLTEKDIAQNVKITPFVRGTWHMRDGDTLVFTPASDWPADTKFKIQIKKSLFNTDAIPNTRTISVRTADITANIDSFNVYPDPAAKKSMIAVAVISFNYPINTADFTDKVSLRLDNAQQDFTVKFDNFNRTAFITSAPIAVTDTAQKLRLKLNRVSAQSGDASTQKLTTNTTIESTDNIFKISELVTTVADTTDGNAQQLILLNTTLGAKKSIKWQDYINAYLLPATTPDDDDTTHDWALDEITPAVISKSKPIKLTPVEFATPNGVYQYAFAYNISDDTTRYIYVSVKSGFESNGGYVIKNGINKVMRVPYPQKSVQIAGSGAILSMTGDKKLGIMARGGADSAHVILYKIKSSEINHLISQTYNLFSNNIEFKSWSFGKYDMSVVFQKTIPFANATPMRANYASVDLGDYLARGGTDNTGIFIVQVGANQDNAENSDQRLILLTDMGIIRKENTDGTSSLFVSNLSSGAPATDIEISVLGRNGNSIWSGRTDDTGHAQIPKFAWSEYKNARQPVAIVARRDNDVSFIPYNSEYSTRVDYSKFDIDGEYQSANIALNAYLFSDRGIYRPGESAVIATIIKNKNFKSLSGIPVRIEIRDARGRDVLSKSVSLDDTGMFDVSYNVQENAPIGTYTVNVFSLNSKNKNQDWLGSTTFQVAEFTPDTMKISASIAGTSDDGWISADNIRATVSLQNLFGTPATDRRISATATLRPIEFTFPEYKQYTFTPNFQTDHGVSENAPAHRQTYTASIPDVQTDDAGHAILDVKFDAPIPVGTYMLALNIRGFESAVSGKSVNTAIVTRVSDAEFLVGYKSNTDLKYINRGADASVNLIAIDNNVAQVSADDMTMRLIRRENLTSLIKDGDGYYKYQTVTRDNVVSTKSVNIAQTGTDIKLDTGNGGTYFIQISDKNDRILANIEYFVAASENLTLSAENNAEMKIKLDKSTYHPGDTVSINITTPYTGSGLITIERDKVYAYKWFNTTTTSSVQTIDIPAEFSGTGYINVSFVRAITSHDIFTNPYTYAVAPFATDTSAHQVDIKLSAPDKIDSNKLTIGYTTNKDAKVMIFAINTGILQVAKYKIPNPIAHFFTKSALQVDTYQTLSLLLPEYKILREFAKTGGGDYDGIDDALSHTLTNPFARRISAPVAFYSGIISATANKPGTITFDIPSEFNGTLTTFAVAATSDAIGAANTTTRVQAPVIVSTTMPTFTAPGDVFQVNTSISNLMPTSGDNARVILDAQTTSNISITGNRTPDAIVPENTEKLFAFDVAVGNTPGNAELTIDAQLQNSQNKTLATRQSISTMSIRPITTFQTRIQTGNIASAHQSIKNFQIDMYPGAGDTTLYVSSNADAAIRPLFMYLNQYEFDCTEQLVSRAMPYALMPTNKFLGTTFDDATKRITDTINTLKTRQNDDGSFDLFTGDARGINNLSNANTAYLTAYVVQFLSVAKSHGFTVPRDMLSRATDYLRTFAGNPITSPSDARAVSYAIYVVTRGGYVTTSYINAFEEYANANIKDWQSTLMGAYIAASYKLLKQSDKATTLIAKYRPDTSAKFAYTSMFDNSVANDAMYAYLMRQHFDAAQSGISQPINAYINSGDYSAYTSAVVIMGLTGVSTDNSDIIKSISVTSGDNKIPGTTVGGTYVVSLGHDMQKITINCTKCTRDTSLSYAIVQSGFPTRVIPATHGIEIIREYYSRDGERITSANIGDIVTVKISARTRGTTEYVPNVAITDLLPGGFIVDSDSIIGNTTHVEAREDRVLIYTDLTRSAQTITYTAQIGAIGTFTVPPIYAQSMYNPQINATGQTGTFRVTNESVK